MSAEKSTDKNDIPINPFDMDAYEPEKVAQRVMDIGVKKTRYPGYKTFVLGLMGGAFISFGSIYELMLYAHPDISSGTAIMIGPFLYAVGYIMAFISGAEVFTTNNLSAMGLASGELSVGEISKNWGLVFFANMFGVMSVVAMFYFSDLAFQFDKAYIDAAKTISAEKLSYGPLETVIIGVFGNMLICSGLWLAMAGRSVLDKFFVMLVPIAAVPALNFQHGTGNMFQFFLSLITERDGVDLDLPSEITIWAVSENLALIAIGNIIGGGLLIAVIYYFVFLRDPFALIGKDESDEDS